MKICIKDGHFKQLNITPVILSLKVNIIDVPSFLSGALAWNGDMLSSGSRDRLILQRDIRTPNTTPERKLIGHKQEVSLYNY